jgi:methionine aminotransferase
MAGGRAVRIPLAPPMFRIDWQRVREAVTPRTALIVINTPHNPTGTVLDAADLDQLEQLLDACDALLLSDEVYEYLVFDAAAHHSVLSRPALAARAFAVFSFGKTYHATGWKTGYCVAPPALTAEFRRVHQFVTFVAVTPIQQGLADFMREEPGYTDVLPAFYQAKRDLFCDLLDGSHWSGTRSAGSYFQLLDYSAIADVPDTEMCERLVSRHGVAAIPISVFYQQPPPSRLLRFCFAKQEATLTRAAELLCAI